MTRRQVRENRRICQPCHRFADCLVHWGRDCRYRYPDTGRRIPRERPPHMARAYRGAEISAGVCVASWDGRR